MDEVAITPVESITVFQPPAWTYAKMRSYLAAALRHSKNNTIQITEKELVEMDGKQFQMFSTVVGQLGGYEYQDGAQIIGVTYWFDPRTSTDLIRADIETPEERDAVPSTQH